MIHAITAVVTARLALSTKNVPSGSFRREHADDDRCEDDNCEDRVPLPVRTPRTAASFDRVATDVVGADCGTDPGVRIGIGRRDRVPNRSSRRCRVVAVTAREKALQTKGKRKKTGTHNDGVQCRYRTPWPRSTT